MDRLTLRIENRSDAASDMPEDISVTGKGITIGRKATNDWALPDNTRFISGQHIVITYEDDSYVLTDVSTNGTFINGTSKRIEGKHTLANGDTVRIGSYIVTVVLTPVVETAIPQISGAQRVQAPPTAGTMRTPTTGIQSHNKTTSTSARGAQTPDFSRFQTGITGAPGVQRPTGGVSQPPVMAPPSPASLIPDDFDDNLLGPDTPEIDATPEAAPTMEEVPAPKAPPAPEPIEVAEPDPFASAALASLPFPASTPAPAPFPTPAPAPTPAPPNEIPAAEVRSVDAPISDASVGGGPFSDAGPVRHAPGDAAPAPAMDLTPKAQPFGDPEPPMQAKAAKPNTEGPFSLSDPTAAPMVPRDPDPALKSPVVEKTDLTPPGLGERFAETTPPRVEPAIAAPPPATPAPVAAPEPTAPAPPPVNALLEGFLEGAGIDDPDSLTVDLRELGVMLGKCARMGTQEMMQMLQDRSAVKLFVAHEDRTMRIASGNNPMKFMMDPDDAFKALFVAPRDGYQTGPDGFDNALSDIRQHQRAMMAAIQPALADMLEGLAPSEIAQDAGGGRLGRGERKSWEEYTKRWESRAAQGENGMLDAFIDAFSRRYNQALDSL